MKENTKLNLYLVSDSSGETVLSVSAACFAQFEGFEVEKFIWPLLRSKLHIDKLISEVEKRPGIVLYTVANDELRASRSVNFVPKTACLMLINLILYWELLFCVAYMWVFS